VADRDSGPASGFRSCLNQRLVKNKIHVAGARDVLRARFSRRVLLIMKLFTSGLTLVLFSVCVIGLTGCGEDNEAPIKEQASRAKGTIPGSRTAQAQTQEEYYEITPGVQGAGSRNGPRPDQGKGYPGPGAKR
jgi:hypothetical protein